MNINNLMEKLTPAEFKMWAYIQLEIQENDFTLGDVISGTYQTPSTVYKGIRTLLLLNLIKRTNPRNQKENKDGIFRAMGELMILSNLPFYKNEKECKDTGQHKKEVL
jgi:hypothetical protein